MKKITSWLLIIATLLTAFVSCSENTKNNDETQTATVTEKESNDEIIADEAETEDELNDNLPEKDFDGASFRIAAAEGTSFGTDYIKQVLAEELNGEVINDAVYNANLNVSERFNITFEPVLAADANGLISNSCKANDDAFEIVTNHDVQMGNLSMEGYFRDVARLPYLDFSMPWWPSYSVD